MTHLPLALLVLWVALLFGARSVLAGKAPDPACWFTADPLTLHAVNLPTNDTFAFTFELYPVGTTLRTTDGTFEQAIAQRPPLTAYFWQRGGGKSLVKPGPQLNDYHVIAICST